MLNETFSVIFKHRESIVLFEMMRNDNDLSNCRKDSSIQTQVATLQMKIVAEDKAVESRTNDFLLDWEKAKPVDGQLRPTDALQVIFRENLLTFYLAK